MSRLDLIGKRFGRLNVLSIHSRTKKSSIKWLCQCDCGNKAIVITNNLTRNNTKSCGCILKEWRENNVKHSESRKGNVSPEYRTWVSIKDRCYNKKNKRYKDWGGRGIKMCDRWLYSFNNFLLDMGRKPTADHSIERINNNSDYNETNCIWATNKEQSKNKRNNRLVTYRGKVITVKELALIFNIKPSAIYNRIKVKPYNEAINFFIKKYSGC